ncbi:MAG: hypothetical protein AAF993_21685, partial [Pseudomonadota bacterium]
RSEIPFTTVDFAEGDGYTTFDLTVYYKDVLPGTDVRLYVENVTDEFYVQNPQRNFARFGPERNVRLSLTKKF